MKSYVLYQAGYAIYGCGKTVDNARADAMKWLDLDDQPSIQSAPFHRWGEAEEDGSLYIREATPELVAELEAVGGDMPFEVNSDGLLDVVRSEQDKRLAELEQVEAELNKKGWSMG